MESKHTDVNGITMRWEEEGEGLPVVFIHGIPTSPALWRHVLPQVQGARCLVWEMVGYGSSIEAGQGRDISVARQVDYLVAWMETLGLGQAVLVGHDLGGGVAQIAAARHSGRAAGLVLTNSIGYDSWPIPSVKLMRALGPLVARLPAALFYYVFSRFLHQGHDDVERAREATQAHWPHYASDFKPTASRLKYSCQAYCQDQSDGTDAEVASRYDVHPVMLSGWKRKLPVLLLPVPIRRRHLAARITAKRGRGGPFLRSASVAHSMDDTPSLWNG
jgi:pimeloyl-ACP methyl ester carboxylesterase